MNRLKLRSTKGWQCKRKRRQGNRFLGANTCGDLVRVPRLSLFFVEKPAYIVAAFNFNRISESALTHAGLLDGFSSTKDYNTSE